MNNDQHHQQSHSNANIGVVIIVDGNVRELENKWVFFNVVADSIVRNYPKVATSCSRVCRRRSLVRRQLKGANLLLVRSSLLPVGRSRSPKLPARLAFKCVFMLEQ